MHLVGSIKRKITVKKNLESESLGLSLTIEKKSIDSPSLLINPIEI